MPVKHDVEVPDDAPSVRLWRGCPVEKMLADPRVRGMYFFDDFRVFDAAYLQQKSYNDNGYGVFFSESCYIRPVQDELDGIIRVHNGGNEEGLAVAIGTGGGYLFSQPWISITRADVRELWFETRMRIMEVVSNQAWLLGFLPVGSIKLTGASTNSCDDWSGTTDHYLGFGVLQDAPSTVRCFYHHNTDTTNLASFPITAETWYKFGIHRDGRDTVRWYLDDSEVASVDLGNLSTSGLAQFPNGEQMIMGLHTRMGSPSESLEYQIDWWRLAQTR